MGKRHLSAMALGVLFVILLCFELSWAVCTYSISPTGRNHNPVVETGSVSVTAPFGCSWIARSNADWISIITAPGGTGNGTVTYSVSANTSTSARTGTMTIAGLTFMVIQPARIICAYSISQTSGSHGSGAGTGSVGVTAPAGCSWTARSDAVWITITSGSSGSGKGAVIYSVSANPGTNARGGRMTIAGLTFTVIQSGITPCTYLLSATSRSHASGAETGSVSVTAPTGCAWTGTSNAAWITFTSGSSGSGNGILNYSVSANTSASARTGTMTIAGQTFTVTQPGGITCSYSISPTSRNHGPGAETGSISITAPSGCAWTATSPYTWITFTSNLKGSGNGTVTYSVSANTSTSVRTATMTIAGQTFTVTQCTYLLSPTSRSHGSGAETGSVSITAPSGCAWAATSNAAWITITSGSSGSGNGTINYSVSANTSTPGRTGTMAIAGQTFMVTQLGGITCTYSISPTSRSHGPGAETGNISVTAPSGCSWNAAAAAHPAWIDIPTKGSIGSGNGTVNYSVSSNTSTSARTATMTIAGGQTFTVTQLGNCTYNLSQTSASHGPGAASGYVSVTAPSGCAWAATSNASWITITSGSSGVGNGTVNYSVSANMTPNTSTSARTATMTIAGGQTFTVNQLGITCTYLLSEASHNHGLGAEAGNVSVTAPSGCAWTAASKVGWITITSGSSGSSNGTVNYSLSANTSRDIRTGTMTIAGLTFTVNQFGTACGYLLSPTSRNHGPGAETGSISITAPSGCFWDAAAAAHPAWIDIPTKGSIGSGNGTVNYSVSSNTSTSARTATLTIGGQTFTVTQSGMTP